MNASAQPNGTAAFPEREPRLGPTRADFSLKTHAKDFLIGAAAACVAVFLRFLFDLPPSILPFFTVVIAVCLVTVSTGFVGGFTAMVVGGLLAWRLILTPGRWGVDGSAVITLVGFAAVTTIIIISSQLYRLSERNKQEATLALAIQEAEQQSLFARELSHRLKNAMAIVQALAGQTFDKDNPDLPKFSSRLKALADAHNLLNEHVKQPTASVREVVENATHAFQHHGRISIDGPEVHIPDQQVISLALALHELGTNAVKYGALSNDHGRITINWQLIDGRFRLEWKEQGGPPVEPPAKCGFGTRLLERTAMGSKIHFEPDGVRCTITQRF